MNWNICMHTVHQFKILAICSRDTCRSSDICCAYLRLWWKVNEANIRIYRHCYLKHDAQDNCLLKFRIRGHSLRLVSVDSRLTRIQQPHFSSISRSSEGLHEPLLYLSVFTDTDHCALIEPTSMQTTFVAICQNHFIFTRKLKITLHYLVLLVTLSSLALNGNTGTH